MTFEAIHARLLPLYADALSPALVRRQGRGGFGSTAINGMLFAGLAAASLRVNERCT